MAQNAAIRSVIAMGILDEVPLDGTSISVNELASRLQFDTEYAGMGSNDLHLNVMLKRDRSPITSSLC